MQVQAQMGTAEYRVSGTRFLDAAQRLPYSCTKWRPIIQQEGRQRKRMRTKQNVLSILASNLMVDSASSSSRVPCASNQQCTRNAKCNSRCAIDRVSWSGHENKRPTNRR